LNSKGIISLQFRLKCVQQFGAVLEEVLAEELGSSFNAEAKQAWKNGIAALVAGISKTLK
jgi:hypothetical protein